MRNKRNKFLTFMFSMLPGAGHMFMGFMKTGISFMAAFFFIIFLATFLSISQFIFILPLIWFYAFFHCLNIASLNDEDFLSIEDEYLFSIDKIIKLDKNIFVKRRLFVGILLLLFGVYLLWNTVIRNLSGIIPDNLYSTIYNMSNFVPKIIIGIAIIFVGVKLIAGKKRESEMDA